MFFPTLTCVVPLPPSVLRASPSLTHSLSLSLTRTHSHSLTRTRTRALAVRDSPSLMHSLTLPHSRTDTKHSLTLAHSLTVSPTLTLTHSHSLIHSHSLTHSHSFTHSHSLTLTPSLTRTHSLTHSRTHTWMYALASPRAVWSPQLLRGRRGTISTAKGSVVRLGVPWCRLVSAAWLVSAAFAWQAWHNLHCQGVGWTPWCPLVRFGLRSFCVAGVALSPMPRGRMYALASPGAVWSPQLLRGRRGTISTAKGSEVRAGVSWCRLASAAFVGGRRGTISTAKGVGCMPWCLLVPFGVRSFCVAGMAVFPVPRGRMYALASPGAVWSCSFSVAGVAQSTDEPAHTQTLTCTHTHTYTRTHTPPHTPTLTHSPHLLSRLQPFSFHGPVKNHVFDQLTHSLQNSLYSLTHTLTHAHSLTLTQSLTLTYAH